MNSLLEAINTLEMKKANDFARRKSEDLQDEIPYNDPELLWNVASSMLSDSEREYIDELADDENDPYDYQNDIYESYMHGDKMSINDFFAHLNSLMENDYIKSGNQNFYNDFKNKYNQDFNTYVKNKPNKKAEEDMFMDILLENQKLPDEQTEWWR